MSPCFSPLFVPFVCPLSKTVVFRYLRGALTQATLRYGVDGGGEARGARRAKGARRGREGRETGEREKERREKERREGGKRV